SKEGLLEIWSTSSRMKLYEIKLGSGARFFPNDNDSSVLILEEYSLGMGYNDFRLSSLDLNTGLYRSRIVRKDIDKIEFTVNNACRCLPIKSRPGEWLCNDNSASLWRIKEAELSVQSVKDFDPGNWGYLPDGLSMLDVPGSDRILLQMGHSEIKDKISGESRFILDSLILMNRSTLDLERVTVSKGRIVPVSKDIHAELGETRITFNSWVGENKFKEVSLGEWRIDRSEVNEEKLVLFCTDEKTGGRRVYRFDRTPPFLCDTIEVSSINGYLTCFGTQLLSVYDGQISSLAKELGYWATWNTKNKFIGSDDLFQPGNCGEILIGQNKLIDLGTLNEVVSDGEFEPDAKKIPLPTSLQAALLKGNFEGKILYVEINRYVGSGKKPYARFVMAERFNYQKIIWASEPFILGKDEFFFPSKVMVSNSGRYVSICSDLQSTEVRGIFIIDLESKGIREFPMKTYGNVVFGWDDRYAMVSGSQGNTSDKWVDWMIALPSFERTPESKLNRSVLLDTAALKVEFSSQFVLVSKYVQGNFIKQKELYAREYLNCVLYSKSDNKVYAGSKSGTLFCWDPAISTPQKKINVGSAGLISLIEKEDHLYALLESGVLVIYDRTELKEQVRIAAIKKDDLDFELAWFTPEGYYKAGKAELSNYHFVRQGKAFPLLSYDVFLNRPEKILEKLGYADFDLIEAYSKVYAKRLQRYGLKDNDQFLLDELPVVSILNKASLVSDVPDANVKLNIEFRSAHKLSALLVKVNGVPLGDINGIPLHNKTSGALSVEVPLGSGKNMITVSAKGMNGVEGMPDQLTVFGRKTNTARVVYAGIGVSQYVDSSMNLRFADDDVQRMAAYLKSTFRDRSDTLLLVNEQVTKKNILAMRDRLMKTSIDDIVILSFSGHGLLDSLGNFYFANHEIDFNDPKNTGISFDEIQLLLTGIPARRKLLLLDACHSGEVDKSQLMVSTGASEVPLGGKGASAEAITSGFFADNSFELMLNNFGDFSNNNGAFVISAAGGEEVAYETEQVGGVFTHAVLRSIADLSGNERFTVNALQKLVNRYVEEFSEGRQKPTTRNQNVSWDWDFEL
ncbi:MAG: caspase domain-containing protein, partial [Bacteroidota bacterium]